MNKCKILVAHANDENIKPALTKLASINSRSGRFENLLIFGDISKLPTRQVEGLPRTYVGVSYAPEQASQDSNDGMSSLHQFGYYKLQNKLTVAYCFLNTEQMEERRQHIMSHFTGIEDYVDILITKEWSALISKKDSTMQEATCVDELMCLLQPRYHFTYRNSSTFFELNPFQWAGTYRTTRYFNLARFNSGAKWAYAFKIDLQSNNDIPPIEDCIANPFETVPKKRSIEDPIKEDSIAKKQQSVGIEQHKVVMPVHCHFCFANPNIEDHMFISIAKRSYLTIAKGPLSVPDGKMNFYGHCLIIPISHISSLPMGRKSDSVTEECIKYETSVAQMNYNVFDKCTVIFEIHSSTNIHFHKQVIPVPTYLIDKFPDTLARKSYLNNDKYPTNAPLDFEIFSNLHDERIQEIFNSGCNYMMFTVYTTPSKVMYFISVYEQERKVDLQFGRRTLAYLLKLPKRIKWNSVYCHQTKSGELREVKKFQEAYQSYDISASKTT